MSATIAIDPAELEAMIRRVVRQELRGELQRLRQDPLAILFDWRHEGPEDVEGDEILAREAEKLSREARKEPRGLTSLEDFAQELAQAEAAGELPR